MKITHNKVGQNLNVSDTKSNKAGEAGKAADAKSTKIQAPGTHAGEAMAAKVELSSRAQDINKIKELASNSPDVDMDKVAKFKQLIADGKYKVDAKAVADRMVDEHMMSAGATSDE